MKTTVTAVLLQRNIYLFTTCLYFKFNRILSHRLTPFHLLPAPISGVRNFISLFSLSPLSTPPPLNLGFKSLSLIGALLEGSTEMAGTPCRRLGSPVCAFSTQWRVHEGPLRTMADRLWLWIWAHLTKRSPFWHLRFALRASISSPTSHSLTRCDMDSIYTILWTKQVLI